MPRLPRQESATGIYHVMNRGVDHGPIFFAAADRTEFLGRLTALHERFEVDVFAYCLMGNHFHLVLRAPPGTLSKAMHHLQSVFARHTNDRLGRNGPLFWQRFHSIPVEDDEYLVWVVRYVHRNPLDLHGVRTPTDHRWSSLRAYMGLSHVPEFLDTSRVLAYFGGRRELAEFTRGNASDGRASPAPVRTADDLITVVACALAVDDLAHRSSPAGGARVTSTVLNLLDDRCTDDRIGRLIADAADHASDRARRQAILHARSRMQAEPGLARVVGWVEETLGWGTAGRKAA